MTIYVIHRYKQDHIRQQGGFIHLVNLLNIAHYDNDALNNEGGAGVTDGPDVYGHFGNGNLLLCLLQLLLSLLKGNADSKFRFNEDIGKCGLRSGRIYWFSRNVCVSSRFYAFRCPSS